MTAQRQFKEEILAQRHLRVFALMCTNSPYLMICHSISKFFSDSGDESKGLHGKQCIAFVGDRVDGREPQAMILPNVAWKWITPKVFEDYEALEEFYQPNNGNQARLFPPPEAETENTTSQTNPQRKKGHKRCRKMTRRPPVQDSKTLTSHECYTYLPTFLD